MDPKSIRLARQKKRLTQRELAEIIGVSVSQMSRFESGSRQPRYAEAVKIAQELEMDISEEVGVEVFSHVRKECGRQLSSLPLPEGPAIVQYPATLSPKSREALKLWLELIATLAAAPE